MRRLIAVLLFCVGLFTIAQAEDTIIGGGISGMYKPRGFTPSCSQSSTFLAAATGVTLAADKTNYDSLICGLVSDGEWNFDVLYIWAAPTQTNASLVNLAKPGTFNGTTSGTISFSAYVGYTGDNSSFSIDSGLNPTSATSTNCAGSPCFTQNSGSIGVYN